MDESFRAWSRPASALAVGVAVVASAAIVARAGVDALHIHHAEKRITVTGSAARRIRSDLIVWRATVRSQAQILADAYKRLAADVSTLVAFIKTRGGGSRG